MYLFSKFQTKISSKKQIAQRRKSDSFHDILRMKNKVRKQLSVKLINNGSLFFQICIRIILLYY